MTTRHQTSSEGALYELVARGVKDTYFLKDARESINPFDWRYKQWPSSIPEIRITEPLNQARWGQRCEFLFDLPGDILTEATLLIDLPSWLPAEFARNNNASNTVGADGFYYGYVSGIAYFLFEKIEIYQDKILLQEVSGDSLFAVKMTKNSWNQGFLDDSLAGVHDGSHLSIMRNATPGQLELPIPMMGCMLPGDTGFPLCGLTKQNFRLRLTLRSLENLVESTNPLLVKPCPWLQTFTQTTTLNGTQTLPAVERSLIGQPLISLRTKQLYLSNEVREEIAQTDFEIPYIRYYDNYFNANALDYAPLSIQLGGTAVIKRFIDAQFTVERIVTYFRNSTALLTNQLWNWIPFSSSTQLVIAGQVREGPWSDLVWNQLSVDAQEERDPRGYVSIMNWSRGWRIEDICPAIRQPTGGINFTTADRPIMSFTLIDIPVNPVLGYKQGFFTCCCESWAVYTIKKGRGRQEFGN
jgi:hypothetical protein